MKWFAPAVVVTALLLQFTAPDGSAVFFATNEIVLIGSPTTCTPPAQTRIMTTMGSICVRESLEQAVKKYEAAK